MRAILLSLIDSFGMLTDEMLWEDTERLGGRVFEALKYYKYLIVLDDMWDTEIWDKIEMLFLKHCARGIVITTRLSDVARSVGTLRSHHHGYLHQMCLLNETDSWKLLCSKVVFGKEECPSTLEKIGKKFAGDCRGLPLTIHAIGQLLSEAPKEKAFWGHVTKDVNSVATGKDSKLLKVLSLSYDRLPDHLRPCLLYTASFPEFYKIRASKLINLLVAEGFLLPNFIQTVESIATDCLEALIDTNLISISEQEHRLKVKSYAMHNLLRDLCNRFSSHEKFILVKKGRFGDVEEGPPQSIRRVIIHPNQGLQNIADLASVSCRSFMSTDYSARLYVPDFAPGTLKLLRVLDLFEFVFREFPEEIDKLENIRNLALACYSDLPHAIFKLRRLQTLIYRVDSDCRANIPSTFWSLRQLRHVKFKGSYFWLEYGNEHAVLEELQTITCIDASNFTRSDFVTRMPNIRKLGICWGVVKDCTVDLSSLLNLETLKIHNSPTSPTALPFS